MLVYTQAHTHTRACRLTEMSKTLKRLQHDQINRTAVQSSPSVKGPYECIAELSSTWLPSGLSWEHSLQTHCATLGKNESKKTKEIRKQEGFCLDASLGNCD